MPGDDVRTISHWTPHVDSKSGDLKTSPAPRTTHSQDYLILVITARSIISSVKMSSVHLKRYIWFSFMAPFTAPLENHFQKEMSKFGSKISIFLQKNGCLLCCNTLSDLDLLF